MPRAARQLLPTAFLLVLFTSAGSSQSIHRLRTVTVNGHEGEIIVYQIDGQTYVNLEALARIAGGNVNLIGDRIKVTIPGASATNTSAPPSTRMSGDFMRNAVQALSRIDEWRATLAYAIERNIPGDGTRIALLRGSATEALRLATVSASTPADQGALQLLTAHYDQVEQWTQKMVEARKNLSAAYSNTTGALKSDSAYQKLQACSTFLGAMLPSGTYAEDGSCR